MTCISRLSKCLWKWPVWRKASTKGHTRTNGRSVDSSCLLRFFFPLFSSPPRRALLATMEKYREGHRGSTLTIATDETVRGFTGRNVHFTLFEFLHLDNGQRPSQRSRQLLIFAASYQRGRDREKQREKLHSHIVN